MKTAWKRIRFVLSASAILSVFVGLAYVMSCEANREARILQEHQSRIVPIESTVSLESDTTYYRIQLDGHTYIVRNGFHSSGMVHDPDCPCERGDNR